MSQAPDTSSPHPVKTVEALNQCIGGNWKHSSASQGFNAIFQQEPAEKIANFLASQGIGCTTQPLHAIKTTRISITQNAAMLAIYHISDQGYGENGARSLHDYLAPKAPSPAPAKW